MNLNNLLYGLHTTPFDCIGLDDIAKETAADDTIQNNMCKKERHGYKDLITFSQK